MAELTYNQKIIFEKTLDMSSGYVLDFSNRTFEAFIRENVNKEIYENSYAKRGDSKANRLRTFWELESNQTVYILMNAMLEYAQITGFSVQKKAFDLVSKLNDIQATKVVDHGALDSYKEKKEFEDIVKLIQSGIDQGGYCAIIDRLHTFFTKVIRNKAKKLGLEIENKPLHSLYGEYIKCLTTKGDIKSKTSITILKNSNSIIQSFNNSRNNESFAHDNKDLLNKEESLLIIRQILNSLEFLDSLTDDRFHFVANTR